MKYKKSINDRNKIQIAKMFKEMNYLKKYYELQKKSKSKYKNFLKKLSNQITSRKLFTLNNGSFDSKRKELHNDIINEYLGNYPSQTKPYINFILGSIGSGKTSLKDSVIMKKEIKSFLYINFDEIKKKFPEYQELLKLNPKKAAHFVQSESSKLAGTLYRKSISNRKNIIYEKNIRLNKEGKLHLISEIKTAFQKKYDISVHVVFLNSYQEAWKRVKLRYEETRRYVPKKDVKDTFENLLPNLNKVLSTNFKNEFLVKFWYNGIWDMQYNVSKGAHVIGILSFQKEHEIEKQNKDDDLIVTFNRVDQQNRNYCGFFFNKIQFLPKKVRKNLMKLQHLKNSLKDLGEH